MFAIRMFDYKLSLIITPSLLPASRAHSLYRFLALLGAAVVCAQNQPPGCKRYPSMPSGPNIIGVLRAQFTEANYP